MTQTVFDTAISAIALMATACGILCLYLAIPRQLLLRAALPAIPTRLAGAGLCAAGLAFWSWLVPMATAIFIFLIVAMTILMTLPFLASRRQLRQGRHS